MIPIISRCTFLKLSTHEQEEHLNAISPAAFHVQYNRYDSLHAMCKEKHKRGDVVYEEPALVVKVDDSQLHRACLMCGLDRETKAAAEEGKGKTQEGKTQEGKTGFIKHILREVDQSIHTVWVCAPCGRKDVTKRVIAASATWSETWGGDLGEMIKTVHTLQMQRHFADRRMDFARAVLLPYR